MSDFLVWFLVLWVFHGLSITVGYHRVLSHRSCVLAKPVLYALVLGAYFAWQGAPIPWAATHRIHHQTSDTINDPHTPKRGLSYSLLTWIWQNNLTAEEISANTKDLQKDKFLCWFKYDKMPADPFRNLSLNIFLRLVLWDVFGPSVALASLLASLVIFMTPNILNTICHLNFGYRNYPTFDNSRNVWWIALFSFGEGWHNNHHAHPRSVFTGFHKWWEFDISTLFILLLARLGLAKEVVR